MNYLICCIVIDDNELANERGLAQQVLVKDALGNVVTGMAVTLSAKTVDQTREKTDLSLRKSTTNSDGVASFAIDIPSDVTALEFQVSRILTCWYFR